jgi:integrase
MNGSERFSIKEAKSGAKTVYILQGYKVDGTRVRKRFDEKERAEGEQHMLELEALDDEAIQPRITRLTEDQLAAAEKATSMLKEGCSLVETVRFYNEHYRPSQKRIRVADALPLYEEAKKKEGIRERSLTENMIVVGRLPKKVWVDEIQPETIREIIDSESPATFNTKRGRMASFFTWAIKEQYCRESPIDRIPSRKVDDLEPEIFALDEVKAILKAAQTVQNGALLPFIVLGFFTGMRPEEIQKLQWADIDLKEKHITVTGRIAKTRRRRIIELHANAVKWLKLCKGTPIYPENFRSIFNELKMEAGYQPDKWKLESLKKKREEQLGIKIEVEDLKFSPWIRDGIRHTAISHHLAELGDENKTATWAGNSPRVIHASYKGLVRKSESESYWTLTQKNIEESNQLELKAVK